MSIPPAFRCAWHGAATVVLLALSCFATAGAASPQLLEGRLQVQVEDRSGEPSHTRYFLLQGSRRIELLTSAGLAGLASGSRVRVRGALRGQQFVLDDSSTGRVALLPSGTTQAPAASGVQNVAVLMVNFADDTSRPVTAATLQSVVFGTVSDFLRENSGDRLWLTGSVQGWYTLPISKTTCDTTQIADLADQAAAAAGVDLSPYTRKFYVFPRNACLFDGLGVSGGAVTRAWFNGKFDMHVFAHEFGHNLGLGHSHALNCDTGPLGATCSSQDYGDVADTMGNGPGHYTAFQKERLGWIDALSTVTASGRYLLAPYALGAGVRALKVPRGTDEWFYLEYRQPQGFDAPLASVDNLTAGVLVHTGSTGPIDSANSSFLLDLTPGSYASAGDLRDAALLPGRSFADAGSGVTITVVSADASGATVDIVLPGAPACIASPPLLTLSSPPAVAPGAASSVAVSLQNRDSAACAATRFDLAARLPAGWAGQLASTSLLLSAGATGSSTLTLTPPAGTAAGKYGFTLGATCTRGSACAASADGTQDVVLPALTQTVATSKSVYRSGDLVGIGVQVLDRGVAVAGAAVSVSITGPTGSSTVLTAVTGANGTASLSYRLSKRKDGPGSYRVMSQASWAGQGSSASVDFLVQ